MTNDPIITHRTRMNTAAINGLSQAISTHASEIRFALTRKEDGETRLQSALADLMADVLCIESAIVEQEQ